MKSLSLILFILLSDFGYVSGQYSLKLNQTKVVESCVNIFKKHANFLNSSVLPINSKKEISGYLDTLISHIINDQ